MYNNICMYNIYVHTFITNFKFISKLEQGGKKKFKKKNKILYQMPILYQSFVNYIQISQLLTYFINKFIIFYVTCYVTCSIPKMNSLFILFRNFETN